MKKSGTVKNILCSLMASSMLLCNIVGVEASEVGASEVGVSEVDYTDPYYLTRSLEDLSTECRYLYDSLAYRGLEEIKIVNGYIEFPSYAGKVEIPLLCRYSNRYEGYELLGSLIPLGDTKGLESSLRRAWYLNGTEVRKSDYSDRLSRIEDDVVSDLDKLYEGAGEFSLVLPSAYEGKPIRAVSDGFFSYCDKLKSIKLSPSIIDFDPVKLEDSPLPDDLVVYTYKNSLVSRDGSSLDNLIEEGKVVLKETVYSMGDSNNDGVVASDDALVVLRYSIGNSDIKFDDEGYAGLYDSIHNMYTVDVDYDNMLTSSDALIILRNSIGL